MLILHLKHSLKKGGFLKLGLYSEIAREGILEARKLLIEKKIQPSTENIRSFRNDVMNSKELIHAYGPRKKVVIMQINKAIKIIKKTANLEVKKIFSI